MIEEINKQAQWIRHLHNYSNELYKYTTYLHTSHIKHKKEIIQQINNIHKTIENLEKSNLELKKEILSFKKEIRELLKKDFEEYHNLILEYLTLKFEHKEKEILEKITNKEQITQKIKEKPTEKIEVIPETYLKNTEKEILSVLFNEGKPMTYSQISNAIGKPINTIRVYMNSLKAKKPIIEEFLTPEGVKVFSIKNSEIVKKLYGLPTTL